MSDLDSPRGPKPDRVSPSPPSVQPHASSAEDDAVDVIVHGGPRGAIAVAGVATAIVIGLWFAFYFLVFLPRGVIR
ncbi:hypothetical protein [Pararobbsia alpina]|uniref:Cytochrome c oxidase subunit IIa n=1 Tax=Pararobbsia alpina TaxID=621374 RepID=A0A6S7AYL7_9BURK|nr:hypothetical protein [Pararobbsia alpina]CAB3781365.1 hypothetical protein LMG28138_01189 [Pararobbsia alpina]